jgi:hypothetical protein
MIYNTRSFFSNLKEKHTFVAKFKFIELWTFLKN